MIENKDTASAMEIDAQEVINNAQLKKDKFYLEEAKLYAARGTCLHENYGAIIVDSKYNVIGHGYTGSPRGLNHCISCQRTEEERANGCGLEKCRSVHAIANALLSPYAKEGVILYLYGINAKTGEKIDAKPCPICMNLLLQSDIKYIKAYKGDGIVTTKISDVRTQRQMDFLTNTAQEDIDSFSCLLGADNLPLL